jgi:L-asparaginase/Glu-tRNA(Gln) amidotransferase subunit D
MSPGPVQQALRTSSDPEGSSDKVLNLRAAVNLGSSERVLYMVFPERLPAGHAATRTATDTPAFTHSPTR